MRIEERESRIECVGPKCPIQCTARLVSAGSGRRESSLRFNAWKTFVRGRCPAKFILEPLASHKALVGSFSAFVQLYT